MFMQWGFMDGPFELLDDEKTGQYGEAVAYAASHPCITLPTDNPPQTFFDGRLSTPLQFDRSILSGKFVAGQSVIGYGAIEMANPDGFYDDIAIRGSIDGRRVVVRVGAANFLGRPPEIRHLADDVDYSKFGVIFDGTARGWELTETGLRLLVRDLGYKLEIPIQKNLYGGLGDLDGGANIAGVVKPILMGRCFNVTPVVVDSANLIYQVNDGPLREVIAVYDRGALLTPITGYTVDLAKGTFKLLAAPAGLITCDAVGDVLTPLTILATTSGGLWLDPSDLSSMFQDAAGLTPVTATGQPVGLIKDKSGSNNHFHQVTSGSRPTLQQDAGGLYYLDCDGSNDFLTSITEGALAFSNGVTLSIAAHADDWAATSYAGLITKHESGGYALGLNGTEYGTGYGIMVEVGDTPDIITASANTALSSAPHVFTASFDLRKIAFRVDGSLVDSLDYGALTTIHYGTTSNATIGADSGTGETPTGNYFNGRIYSVVAIGKGCSTAELTIIDNYMQAAAGILTRPAITTPDIVRHSAMTFGLIPDEQIDPQSFAAWRSQTAAEVGVYINSAENLDKMLSRVCFGAGSWTGFSRQGKLQGAVFKAPSGVSRAVFNEVDILDISRLALPDDINPPNWRRRLNYAKNYTVQTSDLAGAVDLDRKIFLSQQFRISTAQDQSILSHHLLATDPDAIESMFVEQADADDESNRLLGLYSVQRSMYLVTLKTQPFLLDIGHVITLNFPRWDLKIDKQFVICRVSEDAVLNQVEMTVFG